MKNVDIRTMRFRDFAKVSQQQAAYGKDLREFSSVDEIYFFMENMFSEGFSEQHINIALEIFMRDAG